ncbi:hypothetical protein APSETT444_001757 [Aspergillus pseudonomiae]
MEVDHPKQNHGYDDAINIFNGESGDIDVEFTDKEASVVRWKIDLIIVPMVTATEDVPFGSLLTEVHWQMTVSYILSFIDKGILSTAAVYGLRTDLLPIGKWIGSMIFMWGLCVATTAASTNFATLAVNRFFLGLFEASNNPAFTLLVSQYFTKNEHALRSCIWWAGAPIGAFIGDGVSNGIGHVHGKLSQWQCIPGGGLNAFNKIILTGLGFSSVESTVVAMPEHAVQLVMIFVGYCVGQIITPQFFLSTEAPTYPTGFRAYFVTSSMMIAVEAALMFYLLNENKRRDKHALELGVSQNTSDHRIVETDLLDLTDWERPEFRYAW